MLAAAAVLAAALVALPAGAPPAPPEAPSAPLAPGIQLQAQNWGDAVTLTNPNAPAYARPGGGPPTTVTATIDFRSSAPERFTATLVDAQAVDGRQPEPCVAVTTPAPVSCVFEVAVGEGVNDLTLTVEGPGAGSAVIEQGWITGGVFRYTSGLEARDAAGSWQRIPDGGALRLPATMFTSVRYVVRNIGGLPFQVDGSCLDGQVEAGGSVACPITGPRPVASLASDYARTLVLRDPTGSIGRIRVTGAVTASPAAFRLEDPRAAVGQRVALLAQGLTDRDLGQLVVRIGSRPVRLDAASTPDRIVFAMPPAATGSATLEVLQSGIAIARLPMTVTAHPAAPAPPAFPVALVVLVAIGGAVLGVLLWRGVSSARASRRARPPAQPTLSRTT